MIFAIIACILVFCSMGFYASFLSYENEVLRIENEQYLKKISELKEKNINSDLRSNYWEMKWLEAMDSKYDCLIKKEGQ